MMPEAVLMQRNARRKCTQEYPQPWRSIVSFSFSPQKPARRGFDGGGLHLNGSQRRCGCRDISSDLCFWFHRKCQSLDDTHQNSLLGFVNFHVCEPECVIVSALWLEGKWEHIKVTWVGQRRPLRAARCGCRKAEWFYSDLVPGVFLRF